jgi:hypothetical protein
MLTEQSGFQAHGWPPLTGCRSAALIRRAARRIGGELLDGVESGNHAAGRPSPRAYFQTMLKVTLTGIRPLFASTPDFWRQAQPCLGRDEGPALPLPELGVSERGHPSKVMTAPAG